MNEQETSRINGVSVEKWQKYYKNLWFNYSNNNFVDDRGESINTLVDD